MALGWTDMGDLNLLDQTRAAYKARYGDVYPDKKLGAVPVSAGQMYRFVNEMKVGDVVAYPSKSNKMINFCVVEDGYFFEESPVGSYPHRRKVRWVNKFPRTAFSQGALYEIGSALSFFQLKTYSDEFLEC